MGIFYILIHILEYILATILLLNVHIKYRHFVEKKRETFSGFKLRKAF